MAHGERERHNAADQERAMCSGPKSKATGPSWVYDGQAGSYQLAVGLVPLNAPVWAMPM